MTTFNNGPARGIVLKLCRAPFFLRVCIGPLLDDTDNRPKIDALDQLGDVPRAYETLFVYRLTAKPGHCHIRASHGQGGFFPLADYTLVQPQPSDGEMRDRKAWEKWCEANSAMADFLKASTAEAASVSQPPKVDATD